jgi:hypothetical protein
MRCTFETLFPTASKCATRGPQQDLITPLRVPRGHVTGGRTPRTAPSRWRRCAEPDPRAFRLHPLPLKRTIFPSRARRFSSTVRAPRSFTGDDGGCRRSHRRSPHDFCPCNVCVSLRAGGGRRHVAGRLTCTQFFMCNENPRLCSHCLPAHELHSKWSCCRRKRSVTHEHRVHANVWCCCRRRSCSTRRRSASSVAACHRSCSSLCCSTSAMRVRLHSSSQSHACASQTVLRQKNRS